MSRRKTFDVAEFRDWTNNAIALTADMERDRRIALADALEHVLFATGNYRGFSYDASEYLPASEQTPGNVLRPDYDHTRRVFF